MYQKILVPISGKTQGERARASLNQAIRLCSGDITLLHVVNPVSQMLSGNAHSEIQHEEQARGQTLLSPHAAMLEKAHIPHSWRVVEGTPAETIVRVSHEINADLIVMYTDGRDDLGDMLLGSITERVLRTVDINLLAVRR